MVASLKIKQLSHRVEEGKVGVRAGGYVPGEDNQEERAGTSR